MSFTPGSTRKKRLPRSWHNMIAAHPGGDVFSALKGFLLCTWCACREMQKIMEVAAYFRWLLWAGNSIILKNQTVEKWQQRG